MIKFWPSSAPGKGVCSGVKLFGFALNYSQCTVFASLSTFSFVVVVMVVLVVVIVVLSLVSWNVINRYICV